MLQGEMPVNTPSVRLSEKGGGMVIGDSLVVVEPSPEH